MGNERVEIAKGIYRIGEHRYVVNMVEVEEIPVKLYEIPELKKYFDNPIPGFSLNVIQASLGPL